MLGGAQNRLKGNLNGMVDGIKATSNNVATAGKRPIRAFSAVLYQRTSIGTGKQGHRSVASLSQDITSGAEQISGATGALTGLSGSLQQAIRRFKV